MNNGILHDAGVSCGDTSALKASVELVVRETVNRRRCTLLRGFKRGCAAVLASTVALVCCACGGDSSESGESSASSRDSQTSSVVSQVSADGSTSVSSEQQGETSSDSSAAQTSAATDVDDSFFDNTVFVGDSISVGFEMYLESERSDGGSCLGESYVFANGSLGYVNAQYNPAGSDGSVLPTYKGEQKDVADVVAERGADRVYIMLGMNDVAAYDSDTVFTAVKYMVDSIREQSSNVKICLESVTPRIASFAYEDLSNEKIKEFDSQLEEFCSSNGCTYIDLYSVVCDESGNLVEEYCGDPEAMGLHFSFAGFEQIVKYLRAHPDGV